MPIHRKYDKDFFKKWSSDMAYILGFLYADGNIVKSKRGTHFIALYSADKDILTKIKESFQSEHMISARQSETGCVYRIQIGSHEWFDDIKELGLFPNKTKRLMLPDVPQKYLGDFIRGYFDGDGNVWSGVKNRKRALSTKILQATFTSCSHNYLKSLCSVLRRHGVMGGSVYASKTKNFSRLMLSNRDALKLYEIMYNSPHKLYLKRKKIVFEQFMKLRA